MMAVPASDSRLPDDPPTKRAIARSVTEAYEALWDDDRERFERACEIAIGQFRKRDREGAP